MDRPSANEQPQTKLNPENELKRDSVSENGGDEGASGTGKPRFTREVRRLSMGLPITHFEVCTHLSPLVCTF